MAEAARTIALIALWALIFSFGESVARKLVAPAAAANAATIENTALEKRLGDLERRHDKTRELFIGFLSLAMAMLAGLYFKAEDGGPIAAFLVVGGGYTVTNCLVRWILKV
jgi:hypothetical protein